MMLYLKQIVCNGVYEKFENLQNLEFDYDKEIKVILKVNNLEEIYFILEEKIIINGDFVSAQVFELNEYLECINIERNSFDGYRFDEKVVIMVGEGNRV